MPSTTTLRAAAPSPCGLLSAKFCALKGKDATDTECTSASVNASAEDFNKCKLCPRGQAIAKTAPKRWSHVPPPAPSPAPPAQAQKPEPPLSAWDMVKEATGHASQHTLANALGTNQSKISQLFIRLGKGILPEGAVWARILELSGFTSLQLLAVANPKAHAKMLEQLAEPVIIPGDQVPQSAAPAPSLMKAMQEGQTAQEVMGVDYSSGQDRTVEVAMRANGDGTMTVESLREVKIINLDSEDCAAIPSGFERYSPSFRPDGAPGLRIGAKGDLTVTSSALTKFGLQGATHVRLLWNRADSKLALQRCPADDHDAMSLQTKKECSYRSVSAKGFLRAFGINPVRGKLFPITEQGGLLVATIEIQPVKGEEG